MVKGFQAKNKIWGLSITKSIYYDNNNSVYIYIYVCDNV